MYGYELVPADGAADLLPELEPRELFELDKPDAYRGRLQVGDRAGLLVIQARESNGDVVTGSIEVQSRKLRYDAEYQWMLRDISSVLSEAAVNRFAPTKARLSPDDKLYATNTYQQFAFIQSILFSEEYQQAIHRILAQPYISWDQSTTRQAVARGVRGSRSAVRALVSSAARHRLSRPIGRLQAVPREIDETRLAPAVDNVPNRFIKAIIEDWRGLAQSVHDALMSESKMRRVPSAPVLRGLQETRRLRDQLDAVLSTPLFRSVSGLSHQPAGNTVLLRRPGYRELNRIHQQVQLAATLSWDGAEDVFAAGQRDVPTLYEYWVFLQIALIISSLCGKTFEFAKLFEPTSSGLQLKLRKRNAEVLKGSYAVAGQDLELSLWFNRPFRRGTSESWTRDMRPDLSLQISRPAEASLTTATWVHFDAKYRLEELTEIFGTDDASEEEEDSNSFAELGTRALRTDLLKMHAYRDAIRRSSGAYVIYPGVQTDSDNEHFLEYHEVLPGLGALALRPTEDGTVSGTAAIKRLLIDILNHVASIGACERRAQYWQATAFGPPPVPPRNIASIPRPVEGIWFLERPPADELVLLTVVDPSLCIQHSQDRVFFRIDADPLLADRVFRANWVVAVQEDDTVSIWSLEQHGRPVDVSKGPHGQQGIWCAVKAKPRAPAPGWLNATHIRKLLSGALTKLSTWSEVLAEDF